MCVLSHHTYKKKEKKRWAAAHSFTQFIVYCKSFVFPGFSPCPSPTPLFTRNATAVEAEVIPTHPHTHIIYNTHTHTHKGARSQYIYIYTEIVSLSVFVCIYLNVISAVLNMRLYRAASSFAQHARPRTRRTHPPLGRRRFSSLTPYCTPPYT